MKLLFINQFFPPDLAPTGQLLSDVTSALTEQGHDVSVLCSESIYAAGGPSTRHTEAVLRLKGIPFRRSLIGRSASYLSFLFEALRTLLRIKNIDVLVTLTTPPLLPVVGAIAKRLRGCRFFIWEMDLFPESLVTMGMLRRHSLLTRALRKLADLPRRQADGIIVLGPCMRDALIEHGLPPARIQVSENWSKTESAPSPLPNNAWLTVFYSGNLGASHDTETIRAAMALLKNDPHFRFVFAGGGAKRKLFEDQCRQLGLTQVEFIRYAGTSEYESRLSAADIGLVTQTNASLGAVVPSKMYSYMAVGRPVLFIGPPTSTVAQVLDRHHCGWHVPCGSGILAVELLQQLAADRLSLAAAARNARRAYVNQYTAARGTERIAAILGVTAQAHRSDTSARVFGGQQK